MAHIALGRMFCTVAREDNGSIWDELRNFMRETVTFFFKVQLADHNKVCQTGCTEFYAACRNRSLVETNNYSCLTMHNARCRDHQRRVNMVFISIAGREFHL